MPPENNINLPHHRYLLKDFFRAIIVIVVIVAVAFLISYIFGLNKKSDTKVQGLTQEERDVFLDQEINENAVGLTDAEKQALFDLN